MLNGFAIKLWGRRLPSILSSVMTTKSVLLAVLLGLMVMPATLTGTSAQASEISKSDASRAKDVFKFLDKRNWRDAKIHMGKIKDPLLVDLLTWQYLTSRGTPGKFDEAVEFISKHGDWPKRNEIIRIAEETLPSSMSPENVIASIAGIGGPVSAMGHARYGEALLKSGHKEAGILSLRAIWVEGNFTKSQEKNFYKRHKKILSKKDHIDRLDRLIWEKRYYPAKRQIWKVDEDQRKLAIARIWLMRKEGNVDKAISEVPAHLKNDDRLMYERLRWRRTKGKIEGAIEILDNAPAKVSHPEKWWVERAYLARLALREKKPEIAYRISSKHSLTSEAAFEYSDAEWMSGWIALRFLNRPVDAKKHFANMIEAVSYPVSLARGTYWAGRAEEVLGNIDGAKTQYALAAKYPTTFYGQMGQLKIQKNQSNQIDASLEPEIQISSSDAIKINTHPLARAIRMLGELNEQKRLRPFILALDKMEDSNSWHEAVAELAAANGRTDLSLRIRKNAHRTGVPMHTNAYPSIEPPKLKNGATIETPLVLAVIRQESAFYPGARSGAGARGMMQVMPATAKKVAKSARLSFSRDKLLQDPNYNMIIGQTYLASLIKEFEGSYILALAAYNAGPNRARKWMRDHGDPRDGKTDVVDWIEMIPFNETRDYVHRVIGNLHVYRQKIGGKRVALNRGNENFVP